MFPVTFPRGMFNKKPLIKLHAGPSETDPELSIVDYEPGSKKTQIIHIPPRPGSGRDADTQAKITTYIGGFTDITHRFIVPCGQDGKLEEFEWCMNTQGPQHQGNRVLWLQPAPRIRWPRRGRGHCGPCQGDEHVQVVHLLFRRRGSDGGFRGGVGDRDCGCRDPDVPARRSAYCGSDCCLRWSRSVSRREDISSPFWNLSSISVKCNMPVK